MGNLNLMGQFFGLFSSYSHILCQRSQMTTVHHHSFSKQLSLALTIIHHNEVFVALV